MSTTQEHEVKDELADLYDLEATESDDRPEAEADDDDSNVYEVGAYEEAQAQKAEDNQAEPEVEEEVEEKYRNKSAKDIIEMHKHAEKAMRQKMNELSLMEAKLSGLQDATNSILDRQLGNGKAQEEMPGITMDELLENPQEAIMRVVSSVNKPPTSPQGGTQVFMTEEQFNAKHDDASTIGGSEEFTGWIQESPVRTKLLTDALAANDFGVADELLTSYKAVHPEVQAKKDEASAKRDEDVKVLGGIRSSQSSNKGKGPMIRESKVMDMINNDPDRYTTLMSPGGALQLAYEEGRVLMGQ